MPQQTLPLHNGGKNGWHAGEPLQCLSALLCPVIEVSGKLQQSNTGTMTKGIEPSGMKVWVTPPGKEPRPAEDGGNTEWVVEEGSHKYHLRLCNRL